MSANHCGLSAIRCGVSAKHCEVSTKHCGVFAHHCGRVGEVKKKFGVVEMPNVCYVLEQIGNVGVLFEFLITGNPTLYRLSPVFVV